MANRGHRGGHSAYCGVLCNGHILSGEREKEVSIFIDKVMGTSRRSCICVINLFLIIIFILVEFRLYLHVP